MKALIVYNNFSGKNKAEDKIDKACEILKSKYEIDKYESTSPKSITTHIKEVGHYYDLIIVAGGDGSINEAINGIMQLDYKPKLAFIPAGTCNDATKSFGIGNNVEKACKIILEEQSVKTDILKVNDKYFTYGLACGYLTEVSYSATRKSKKVFGKIAYYFQCLKAVFKTKHINIKVKNDDFEYYGDYALMLALNSRYLAGFKLKYKNPVVLNNGKIHVVLIRKTNKIINVFDFGMFLLFGYKYKHNIVSFDCSEFHLESKYFLDLNTDGEKYENIKVADVSIYNKSIEIIVESGVKDKYFNKTN